MWSGPKSWTNSFGWNRLEVTPACFLFWLGQVLEEAHHVLRLVGGEAVEVGENLLVEEDCVPHLRAEELRWGDLQVLADFQEAWDGGGIFPCLDFVYVGFVLP